MIKYKYVLKDFRKKTLQTVSGEVSDEGKVIIEVNHNQPAVGFIEIEWGCLPSEPQ